VELDDGLLLLERELAPLDVRPEVVGPPEPAALAAPPQPCTSSELDSNISTHYTHLIHARTQLIDDDEHTSKRNGRRKKERGASSSSQLFFFEVNL
jgi:hypothetical protein